MTPLPAGLYLVATPIGTARDITLRALDTLASADVLVAEDTRSLKHLMAIHGIETGGRPVLAYHDHSGESVREKIVAQIADGRSVAYASEAGTPLIADPGFALARSVRDAGGALTSVPGPSAVVTALTLGGLPTDRFLFMGFLPPKAAARRKALAEVAGIRATLVIYESPKRVHALLSDLAQGLGEMREAALCRELTKRFEEVVRAPLGELSGRIGATTPKGECVVLVGPPGEAPEVSDTDLSAALDAALADRTLRDAARDVSVRFGVPRKRVYDLGVAGKRRGGGA